MRILLAGATGAIGRPLIRCLKENGHTVFGLARSVSIAARAPRPGRTKTACRCGPASAPTVWRQTSKLRSATR